MPVSAFAEAVVAEHGVTVLPADVMLFEGNYFRLGLGRTTLPQALAHVEQYIIDRFN